MTDIDKDVQNIPQISKEYCLDTKSREKLYVKICAAAIEKDIMDWSIKITWLSYFFTNINENYYQLGSKTLQCKIGAYIGYYLNYTLF